MFGLVVRFTCSDEASAEAFDALTDETVTQIRVHEPDTMVYAVHQSESAPLVRVLYELYRDREAFDAHERQEHTRRFLAEREQYLASAEVEFLSLRTDKGVTA